VRRRAGSGAVKSRFDERYLVVAGACLTQFTVIGVLFAYGLFFKELEAEFGWSRTMLSSCMSAAFLVMGILAILGGRLSDQLGPGWVLGVTGLLYGLGYALLAGITEPWQLFVVYGLFVGVGMSTHDVVTLSTVARWFDKRRGMMTGLAKVGPAGGQVLVPPLAAFLIVGFGWRSALVVLGVGSAVLLVAAAALMRKPPAIGATDPDLPQQDVTFGAARRTRLFWTLCAIQFLFFPSLITVPIHIVVHGMDMGMTATGAAVLVSVIGGCSVAGRLVVGAFVDRIGGKGAFVMCLVPLIASLTGFLFVETKSLLFATVALYGFAHGGLFTVVSPTIAQYFGTRALGMLFGAIVFFGTLGGALGPILAGWVFDMTQSYYLAFSILAILAAVALLLVLSLPSRAKTINL